jgi:hypothetical protein
MATHDHEGRSTGDLDRRHDHGRAFVPPARVPGDPGREAVAAVDAALIGASRDARVERAANPAPRRSFGYVGRFVNVIVPDESRITAVLVATIDDAAVGAVARETVRWFRWDEATGFALVERSAVGETGDYVWGEIDAGGLYAAIGINAEPRIARTLSVLRSLEGWLDLDDLRSWLGPSMCELILCAPEFAQPFDPGMERRLMEANLHAGLPGAWTPGGMAIAPPVENVCDTCRRTFEKSPPERQLLEPLDTVPARVGRWDVDESTPEAEDVVLAVHAAVMSNGVVAYFAGSENVRTQHETGGAAIDNARIWDPETRAVRRIGSPEEHDLFCCGHAFLPDGQLLAAGGTLKWGGGAHPVHGDHYAGRRTTSVLAAAPTASANPWTRARRLLPERGADTGGGAWYPTLVTLPSGRVARLAGHPRLDDTRHSNTMVETFDPTTRTWTDEGPASDLPTPSDEPAPLYPRAHVLPDGRLFCATPLGGPHGGAAGVSWLWDPAQKAWSPLTSGPGAEYGGFDVSSVLLPLRPDDHYRARVLMTNRREPMTIDLGDPTPTWRATAPRALGNVVTGPPVRHHATSVLLPDGTVLVVGGHFGLGAREVPVLEAEMYDPAAGTWSVAAPAAVPRVYHSVALLLPDGRVWTAGSDYGNGNHEARIELFSPRYLFSGPRPTIGSAPDVIQVRDAFVVETADAPSIRSVAIIRCGSTTHAFNGDQRYVALEVEARDDRRLYVVAPPSLNVAPPGCYMLFLVDHTGVPSVAKLVRVE